MAAVEDFIKDRVGTIIGIIAHMDNGDEIAKTFPGREILGYYRKSIDRTTDFYGRILSRGNTVISLIFRDKQ